MNNTPESLFPSLGIRRYAEIDSTNTEGKRLIRAGAALPLLLVADHQTAGRGRLGRNFYSPKNTGLYFTLVVSPHGGPADAVPLTQAAAVAALRAIRRLTGADVTVKWVNDLYLGPKKIAGILTEAAAAPDGSLAVLIGIGINLTTEDFPEDIAERAGALRTDIPKETLLTEIVKELLPFAQNPGDRSWLEDYRSCSNVVGKRVNVLRGETSRVAEALEIGDDGALLVRFEDGSEEALTSGEISIRFA
ncbi:MAG: biotin--[acetyl-CoA-carboxylase] ligase [Clostridia bacterium]|nr:biotin--[acetyl-CoA-carboxylase] ligase [Clostridia bacterium]